MKTYQLSIKQKLVFALGCFFFVFLAFKSTTKAPYLAQKIITFGGFFFGFGGILLLFSKMWLELTEDGIKLYKKFFLFKTFLAEQVRWKEIDTVDEVSFLGISRNMMLCRFDSKGTSRIQVFIHLGSFTNSRELIVDILKRLPKGLQIPKILVRMSKGFSFQELLSADDKKTVPNPFEQSTIDSLKCKEDA